MELVKIWEMLVSVPIHGLQVKTCILFFGTNVGLVNHLKPEFTIFMFTHYKPRIAVAFLGL